MTWTVFNDMHGGGHLKVESYERIYINTARDPAMAVFRDRFGQDPEKITCQCCGQDYSIREYDSLEAATKYHRSRGPLADQTIDTTTDEYVERDDICIIYGGDI